MWDRRFLSGVVITSEARNLLLLALEQPLRKQQIPHGLNFTPTSAETALVGDPGSAVRDDNSKSRIRTLLMQYSIAPGFCGPGAKAHGLKASFFRSAEALLPPHKCGGSHREAMVRAVALRREKGHNIRGENPPTLPRLPIPKLKHARILCR